MTRETIEGECSACQGTGLYVGFAEKDGAAVVCHHCRGSGKMNLEFRRFTGRKKREGVQRVYATNVGIWVTPSVPGGVSFSAWESGEEDPYAPGNEMRDHACPFLWYQAVDYEKRPSWNRCMGYGGGISKCKHYPDKDLCWARWDDEAFAGVL